MGQRGKEACSETTDLLQGREGFCVQCTSLAPVTATRVRQETAKGREKDCTWEFPGFLFKEEPSTSSSLQSKPPLLLPCFFLLNVLLNLLPAPSEVCRCSLMAPRHPRRDLCLLSVFAAPAPGRPWRGFHILPLPAMPCSVASPSDLTLSSLCPSVGTPRACQHLHSCLPPQPHF